MKKLLCLGLACLGRRCSTVGRDMELHSTLPGWRGLLTKPCMSP
jgi:hypothetical protein